MFRSLLFLMLMLPVLAGAHPAGDPSSPEQVRFQTSIEIAIAEAGETGKLILVEFYASWCHPCRWMEATTFRDPDVIAMMERRFVPLKADIDMKEGFRLFEQFGVEVLPTTLVLDASGKVIARSEEALSAAQLVDLLGSVQQSETASPLAVKENKTVQQNENVSIVKENLPAPRVSMEAPLPKAPETVSLPAPPTSGFAVQVGVFTLEANMQAKVQELRSLGDYPVWVQRTGEGPASTFKLLSGQFATRPEAEAWRAQLATARIPGYIRDLAAP